MAGHLNSMKIDSFAQHSASQILPSYVVAFAPTICDDDICNIIIIIIIIISIPNIIVSIRSHNIISSTYTQYLQYWNCIYSIIS